MWIIPPQPNDDHTLAINLNTIDEITIEINNKNFFIHLRKDFFPNEHKEHVIGPYSTQEKALELFFQLINALKSHEKIFHVKKLE